MCIDDGDSLYEHDDDYDDDNDDDEDYAGEEGHKVGRDLSGAANTLCLTVILSVKAVKCEKCECSETCPTFSVKALRDKVNLVILLCRSFKSLYPVLPWRRL